MAAGDPLGWFEFAVMDAVYRGALRSRQGVGRVLGLLSEPGGYAVMYDALRRCERHGLLRSERDRSGRRYELTAAGRRRLRTERRFRAALAGLLVRSGTARRG